jgi:hypothetical protein
LNRAILMHSMQTIPADCDGLIFQFLSLRELLAVRSCSRMLLRRHAPSASLVPWKLVHPTIERLRQQVLRNLASAKLMWSAYAFGGDRVHVWNVLQVACGRGDLPMARWLAARFRLAHCEIDTLRAACIRGDLPMVQWLATRFDFPVKAICRRSYNAPLECACVNGHLRVAQWLVGRYGSRHCPRMAELLGPICAQKYFTVARWIAQHFRITTAEVRANRILEWACECGGLATAQWVVGRFELTSDDARAHNAGALRAAVRGDDLDTAQWLVQYFGFTSADIRAMGIGALLSVSCQSECLKMAQWLADYSGLTPANISDEVVQNILNGACYHNHIRIARWFVARFQPNLAALSIWVHNATSIWLSDQKNNALQSRV